jgi:redox-sensitive bicupin YhaK (pirin superfamily)
MPPDLELALPARDADLLGTPIRRALPRRLRRSLGPFVFLDHMGPRALPPGTGVDVPPHPHIGLATLTYLFEGALLHRDSLGHVQEIRPGEVNWMSAGRGIVHSERTPPAARAAGGQLHGLQFWVALPRAHEEDDPSFQHAARESLPTLDRAGAHLVLAAGTAFGSRAPIETSSELFLLHAELPAEGTLPLPDEHPERAAYVVAGRVRIDGQEHGPGSLLVLAPRARTLQALEPTNLALFGGAPLDGLRHMRWNFVSSDSALISAAERAWESGGFPQVPGDDERVPLPAP